MQVKMHKFTPFVRFLQLFHHFFSLSGFYIFFLLRYFFPSRFSSLVHCSFIDGVVAIDYGCGINMFHPNGTSPFCTDKAFRNHFFLLQLFASTSLGVWKKRVRNSSMLRARRKKLPAKWGKKSRRLPTFPWTYLSVNNIPVNAIFLPGFSLFFHFSKWLLFVVTFGPV